MNKKYLRMFSPDDMGGTATATAPQAGDGAANPEGSQAEPTAAPRSQADHTTSTTPQAGESPSSQQPQTEPKQEPKAEPKSSRSNEEYEREIERLRKENASHRTRNKELEDFKKKIDEQNLSEQERVAKQLAELQREHEDYRTGVQERIITTEIRAQAADLGFADFQDAVRLINRSELEYDEDGSPSNARALLEQLAKAKPYLLKQQQSAPRPAPTSSGGATNPSRSATQSMPEKIDAEYISKLTPADYEKLTPEQRRRIAEANINRYLR